jgi:hypothetical protein
LAKFTAPEVSAVPVKKIRLEIEMEYLLRPESVEQFFSGSVKFAKQSDQLCDLESFFICKLFKDGADFPIISGSHQVYVKLERFFFKGEHEANHAVHFFIGQFFPEIQTFQ